MNVINRTFNNTIYQTLQYNTMAASAIIDFVHDNYLTVNNVTKDAITIYDTNGILLTIPVDSWLVIAEHDNTEIYILDTLKYKNMFNIVLI